METKSLVFGIIGFMLGGLLVAVAATTFDQPKVTDEMPMSEMTEQLKTKKSDAYDAAFIDNMIRHHQAAVDMAKLSEKQAKHEEIKQLSSDIIAAQEKEISQMKEWQRRWNYSDMMEQMH